MKLKLYVLDLEIPTKIKRRALLIGVPLALLLGASAVAIAQVPHTFAPDQVLSAQEMNDNFKSLDDRVAKTEVYTNPVTMEKYSVHAGVCGVTDTTTTGNIGGYSAAKTACEQKCGNSPTAHMCDGAELVRWVATDGAIPAGQHWYATGSQALYNDGVQIFQKNDCDAYKFGGGNRMGAVWVSTTGPGYDQCSASLKILCCD